MKVLITGDLGFIGRHCSRRLNERGARVEGMDLRSGCDCRDFFRSRRDQYDLVVHLAAVVGGRETIEGDPLGIATDLSIDAEFFNWAVRTEQPRVVYFSSSAAYPVQLQQSPYLLRESDIDLSAVRNPDLSYGWAKLTGEMLAGYARAEGVAVHVLRPFSGYGEDQDVSYPFPSFIRRVIERADPFEIWGDGEQVRDFIHVDDVVNAMLCALDRDIQGPVNLGWGRPISFNQLARMCFDVAGIRPPAIWHRHDKPVGVPYRCADNSLMLSFYEPSVCLEEGIERALSGCRQDVAFGSRR